MRTASRVSPSLNIELLTDLFEDKLNQEAFLCQSTIFGRAKVFDGPLLTTSFKDRQMSAKMHCLYGVPIESPRRTRYALSYPYACSMVYDLRNYTDHALWGPFLDDGMASVDWEKVEAVMIDLGHNLRLFTEESNVVKFPLWDKPWHGGTPNSFNSISLLHPDQPLPPSDARDPYNISGTWMRASSNCTYLTDGVC